MRYLLQFLAIAVVLGTLVFLLAGQLRQPRPPGDLDNAGISNAALLAWVVVGSGLAMAFLLVLDMLLGS